MSQTKQSKPIKSQPLFKNISSLQPEDWGFSLKVQVLDVHKKLHRVLLNGEKIEINEATVGDETGTIIFTVRGSENKRRPDNINLVQQGRHLILRNAKIEMYRSFMRLSVDIWGLVEEDKNHTIKTVKTDNNVSEQEYELVDPNAQNENQDNQNNQRSSGSREVSTRGRESSWRGGRGRGRGRGRGGSPNRDDRERSIRGRDRDESRGRGRGFGRGTRGSGRGEFRGDFRGRPREFREISEEDQEEISEEGQEENLEEGQEGNLEEDQEDNSEDHQEDHPEETEINRIQLTSFQVFLNQYDGCHFNILFS